MLDPNGCAEYWRFAYQHNVANLKANGWQRVVRNDLPRGRMRGNICVRRMSLPVKRSVDCISLYRLRQDVVDEKEGGDKRAHPTNPANVRKLNAHQGMYSAFNRTGRPIGSWATTAVPRIVVRGSLSEPLGDNVLQPIVISRPFAWIAEHIICLV